MDEEKTLAEQELKEQAEAEKERITELLKDANVSKARCRALKPVIENVSWMKAKLDDARAKIRDASVVIPYDNGGGQRGLRENPLFKGYEGLWRSYMAGMKQILEALPPEAEQQKAQELERPKTMLDIVRERHKS